MINITTLGKVTWLQLFSLILGISILVCFCQLVRFDRAKEKITEYTSNPPQKHGKTRYKCPRMGDKWVVITSIHYPTDSIRSLSLITDWITIVVADGKTPTDWFKNDSQLSVILLSLEEQLSLDFELTDVLPTANYARKNLGYLIAIQCGAKFIYETDDDNSLLNKKQIDLLKEGVFVPKAIPTENSSLPMVNPHAHFGRPDIWPRGFPLQSIRDSDINEFYNVGSFRNVSPWIQQGLAALDPDVDAIFRLTRHKEIGKVQFKTIPKAIYIDRGVFAPFNTQNTIYSSEAFFGLYIPFTTTFRVCDIWRGYWVQRILWETDGSLLFRPSTVNQTRNAHDNYKDFREEWDLYNKSGDLVTFLLQWKPKSSILYENVLDITQQITDKQFWEPLEMKGIRAWISDLKKVGYVPPLLRKVSKDIKTTNITRVAACLTGQLQRISLAFPQSLAFLKDKFFPHDTTTKMDFFYYVSTAGGYKPEDELYLKTQLNPVVGILYDDIPLNPPHKKVDLGLKSGILPNNLWQQLYAEKRCYELTERDKLKYDCMIRIRTDHVLSLKNESLTALTWEEMRKGNIVVPKWYCDRKDDRVNHCMSDKLAFGPYDKMLHYMKRFDYITMDALPSLHAETMLSFIMNYHNYTVRKLAWDYNEINH